MRRANRKHASAVRPLAKLVLALGVLLLATAALTGDPGADKKKENPDALKAQIERERDPIKRAQFQLRLADLRLDEARKQYDAADDETGLATLRDMQALIESVEEGLFATGRDPRKKPKGFKDAEIQLRTMQRRLQDLRMSVPVDLRPPIEGIMKRLAEIQEEFLYGIMRVKEPQARATPPKEPKP